MNNPVFHPFLTSLAAINRLQRDGRLGWPGGLGGKPQPKTSAWDADDGHLPTTAPPPTLFVSFA